MISGITNDWLYDAYRNEQSYFIFNLLEERCSTVPDSLYAREIITAITPEQPDTEVLHLLTYAKRFPLPIAIDGSLESIMLYANIQRGRNLDTLSDAEIQAIQLALNSFERLQPLDIDDFKELERLQVVLEQALRIQRSSQAANAQDRVKRLLRKQPIKEIKRQQQVPEVRQPVYNQARVSSDPQIPPPQYRSPEVLISSDPAVRQDRAKEGLSPEEIRAKIKEAEENNKVFEQHDLLLALVNEFGGNPDMVQGRFDRLRASFNKDNGALATSIIKRLNTIQQTEQSTLLQQLLEKFEYATLDFLQDFWHYLGAYLLLGKQLQVDRIMLLSLKKAIQLRNAERFDESDDLLEIIFSAMQVRGQEMQYLRFIVENSAELIDDITYKVYRQCIKTLELNQRIPFRAIIEPFYQRQQVTPLELLERELRLDLIDATLHQGPEVIEEWVEYAQYHSYDEMALMAEGLKQLKNLCGNQTRIWRELAFSILASDVLPPLPEDMEDIEEDLAIMGLPALSLANFNPENNKIIMLCRKYHDHLGYSGDTRTTLDTILAMIDGTMNEELARSIQRQMEILLLYEYEPGVRRFMSIFFQHDTITDKAHGCVVAAFFTRKHGYNEYFWNAYLGAIEEAFQYPGRFYAMLDFWFVRPKTFSDPYIMQEFLLRLPGMLAKLQDDQGKKVTWYTIVQKYLKPHMGKEEQLPRRVADLFERKSEIKKHEEWLRDENTEEQGLEFWKYYWKSFESLLLRDAELTIDLLTFWFDKSFEILPKLSYLPHQFFMGLPQALKETTGKQGFNNIAQKIDKLALEEKYSWFPVVQPFFHV